MRKTGCPCRGILEYYLIMILFFLPSFPPPLHFPPLFSFFLPLEELRLQLYILSSCKDRIRAIICSIIFPMNEFFKFYIFFSILTFHFMLDVLQKSFSSNN